MEKKGSSQSNIFSNSIARSPSIMTSHQMNNHQSSTTQLLSQNVTKNEIAAAMAAPVDYLDYDKVPSTEVNLLFASIISRFTGGHIDNLTEKTLERGISLWIGNCQPKFRRNGALPQTEHDQWWRRNS